MNINIPQILYAPLLCEVDRVYVYDFMVEVADFVRAGDW